MQSHTRADQTRPKLGPARQLRNSEQSVVVVATTMALSLSSLWSSKELTLARLLQFCWTRRTPRGQFSRHLKANNIDDIRCVDHWSLVGNVLVTSDRHILLVIRWVGCQPNTGVKIEKSYIVKCKLWKLRLAGMCSWKLEVGLRKKEHQSTAN